MDRARALSLIRALSDANGAPGFEDEVVAVVRGHAADLGEVREDTYRNCYIHRPENLGGRPVVQLDAHSDEVAFMVQAIAADGTLKFIPLGGWVPSCVPAHKVRVRNRYGEYLQGVVASRPPTLPDPRPSGAPRRNLATWPSDVGATSREDAETNFGIRIAEPVVPDVWFSYDEGRDLMLGKAFDCRLGCAALILTIWELAGQALSVDVVGACAAQEEMGMRGARVTASAVRPDMAIVFEGCPADDTLGAADMAQTALKKGPMLRHVDRRHDHPPAFPAPGA